jgi:hypothetical protein
LTIAEPFDRCCIQSGNSYSVPAANLFGDIRLGHMNAVWLHAGGEAILLIVFKVRRFLMKRGTMIAAGGVGVGVLAS